MSCGGELFIVGLCFGILIWGVGWFFVVFCFVFVFEGFVSFFGLWIFFSFFRVSY